MKIRLQSLACIWLIVVGSWWINGCQDAQHRTTTGIKKGHVAADTVAYFLEKAAQSKQPFQPLNALLKKFEGIETPDTTDLYQLSRLAIAYNVYGRPETYVKISRKILRESQKNKWHRRAAKACYFISEYHKNKEAADSALFYILKGIQWAKPIHDQEFKGELYLSKGRIELDVGDYYNAEQSGIQAWECLKKNRINDTKYFALNLIAIAANELKSYDFSIEFHLKALDIARQLGPSSEYMIETSLNNLGIVYQNKNDYQTAIRYFEKALQNKELSKGAPLLYAITYDNWAYAQFKLHPSTSYVRALRAALAFKKSHQITNGEVLSHLHLSDCYWHLHQSKEAQREAIIALQLANQYQFIDGRLLSYKQLSQVLPSRSIPYMNAYLKLQDSIAENERIRKNQFARIKFKTDEIMEERNALLERNRTLLLLVILVASLAVALYVIRVQKAKTRELVLKQEQQKANEEIYQLLMQQQQLIDETRQQEKKRIAREIHDGILGQLFGTRIQLESMNDMDTSSAKEKRFHYLQQLQQVEVELRQISHNMHAEKSNKYDNFVSLVYQWIEEQRLISKADIEIWFDEQIPWKSIQTTAKINIFRIVQESMQNCHKYAAAKHIAIKFEQKGTTIQYQITDDGQGFELNKKRKGIGLQNIEMRVKELGGDWNIESTINKGTKIVVNLPITPST